MDGAAGDNKRAGGSTGEPTASIGTADRNRQDHILGSHFDPELSNIQTPYQQPPMLMGAPQVIEPYSVPTGILPMLGENQ